ncbi:MULTISPECIES: aldehyde dehydrogenase family protein [Phyllobacteriaceae]|uniref:aldehyde dehydrogenase family protein n=1 Tax=Phyllobacteriaceae TaxID=69277 RepID=UPI0004B72C47|nr:MULTISPECIES: aldehyde dehydrogenase family protein [Mesorhizobium]MBN9235917.1 aldehyde dehydrogenase family protein [Mesorhizobium sp.]MDQ0327938.1 phenylacetaldehyde dehydrogenase [Mesorhizobium sp. YL-MeA3-2017]
MNERIAPPISAAAAAFLARSHRPFIDGRFVDAAGEGLPVDDSATGEIVARVPESGPQLVDLAVRAARAALDGPWGSMRPVDRQRLMLKLADLVEADADLLAEIESIENGKSLGVAKMLSAGGTVDWLRYYAGWATKIEGSTFQVSIPVPPGAKHHAMTVMEPVGVVGAIVPWNFPLLIGTWKIAPALAAGCTVVLKPPHETPLGLLRLAELIEAAGFPPGVVNIVPGSGAVTGEALINHPGIDKLTFTGSTTIGKRVGHAAVDRVARFTLELGSKSPMILLSDMEDGIEPLLAGLGMFFNQGQVCTSAARILIEKPIYERTLARLAEIADGMTLGAGRDEGAQINPLVSAKHRHSVMGYVERSLAAGAEQISGTRTVPAKGHYVAPTILHNVSHDMEIVREEVFGPVVAAMPVADLDEAIRVANDTRYGLSASIWTRDMGKAMTAIHALKAGTVWVNSHNTLDAAAPFGGFKQSGIGREHGRAALEGYLETKTVIMRYA